MDEASFKQHATRIVEAFWSSADLDEARASLVELQSPKWHPLFVKKLISSALDGASKRCELASQLLTSMRPVITEQQAVTGFMLLANAVADLTLDVPRAPHIIASMIARGVADGVLPPDFAGNLMRLDSVELQADTQQVGASARERPHEASRQVGLLDRAKLAISSQYRGPNPTTQACNCDHQCMMMPAGERGGASEACSGHHTSRIPNVR